MSLTNQLTQGRIVWAVVPGRRGGETKERPVVLLSSAVGLGEDDEIVGVAASTSLPAQRPLPPEYVLLPHSANPQARSPTGLTSPGAAICDWPVRLRVGDIRVAAQ